jgi:hypothetical protein
MSLLLAVLHDIPYSKYTYSTVYITITGHMVPFAYSRRNDDYANGLLERVLLLKSTDGSIK